MLEKSTTSAGSHITNRHSRHGKAVRRAGSPDAGKAAVLHAEQRTRGKFKSPLGIELLALDLDGTLLNSRKAISPRTHTAVRLAMNLGVRVVLASARPPRSVAFYYDALELATPQINYNGALIWDQRGGKILRHRPLEAAKARRVIDFARGRFPELLVSVEILDKWYTDHYADMPEYATETAKHFSPDFIGPLEAFLTVPVTKVMLLGNPEWIAALEGEIPAKFGEQISHTRSDPHLLQILAPGVNKGEALAEIAQGMNVPREKVLAIGDAPNDLAMLRWAGTGVAMGNAWPEVRDACSHQVAGNDEDGVAAAIEKLVLGKRLRH